MQVVDVDTVVIVMHLCTYYDRWQCADCRYVCNYLFCL